MFLDNLLLSLFYSLISYTPCPGNSLVTHRSSSSERFSMQMYSVCPVVKYHFANGSRILRQPSANRRLAFSPRLVTGQSRTSRVLLFTFGGWVFRFILYTVYLPYPSFSRCQSCIKIIPRREAKRVSRKGKKESSDYSLLFSLVTPKCRLLPD